MATSKNKEQDKEEDITLSSALLAPINSIFEAQIHSARAFLNFLLQMGFRHKPTPQEEEELKKDRKKNQPLLNELEQRKKAKERISEIYRKKEEIGTLTSDEIAELQELSARYGDLYQQSIEFIDNTGNKFMVNIPNLALLPVRPLSINEAEFSYEFEVKEHKKFSQMNAAMKTEEGEEATSRPWFLIKEPQSLRGGFAPRKAESNSSTIKINIKVSNTPMPYGLERLMVHLTNSMEAIDKKDS